MKILTYRMTYDTGFAPNPFHGVLTLATCTPNHKRAELEKGDYIVGIESNALMEQRKSKGLCKEKNNLLIFVGEASEILSLNDYFNDLRFKKKKYKKNKCWILRRGDNIYYEDGGMWKWLRGHDHDDKSITFFHRNSLDHLYKTNRHVIYKDIYGNRVFICHRFTYFGDKCEEFDKRFLDCIVKAQGIKYCYENNSKFKDFKNYLDSLIGKGRIGKPIHCHIKHYCIKHYCKDKL